MRNDHSHGKTQPDLLRQLGYETQDVDAKGLVQWIAYLGIFLVAMAAISLGVYKLFIPNDQIAEVPTTALTTPSTDQIGAQLAKSQYPLLQKDPRAELNEFRRKE